MRNTYKDCLAIRLSQEQIMRQALNEKAERVRRLESELQNLRCQLSRQEAACLGKKCQPSLS